VSEAVKRNQFAIDRNCEGSAREGMCRNSTLKNANGAGEAALLTVRIGWELKFIVSVLFDQASAPKRLSKLDYLHWNADCQRFSAGL